MTCGAEVGHAVRVIAESLDYVCAERLTPNLAWMAAHLVKQGELMISPELLTQLEQISVSSVRRITQGMERDLPPACLLARTRRQVRVRLCKQSQTGAGCRGVGRNAPTFG